MRVLIVTNMYPTSAEPWFGCFVKEQVDDLHELGVELELIHFDGRSDRRAYLRASREVHSRLRRGHIDLVHAHYGLTGAATALVFPSVPLVTTFHGSDYAGPTWQRLVSTAAALRSTSIVVSPAGRTRLHTERATVIPMGVNTSLFRPDDRRAARRRLGWPEDGRYALLAGSRRNPVKGASLFDAAVQEARAHVPELTGKALEGFDRNEVVLAFNAADVTVVASRSEGSPVTVRESLACETPVVSVDVGDVSSVIAQLPGCAIVSRDPVSIADGIYRAIRGPRDSSLRARAEMTSRPAVAQRVLNVYRDVLRRDGDRGGKKRRSRDSRA
ncbi:MAG: glycosyltransferase [Solirubrobacteraceae bacterium]